MYYCQDCKKKFEHFKKVYETHGLDCPPYEIFYVCPHCGSAHIKKIERYYCKCCGARIFKPTDYCSPACKKRGEYLWEMQRKRKKELLESPIYKAVREIEAYNRENGTNLSYGQYFARKQYEH